MVSLTFLQASLLSLSSITTTTSAALYSQYNYAPTSRTLYPSSIYTTTGTIANPSHLLGPPNGGLTTFRNAASVTYDFGKNIEGIVALDIASSSKSQFVGVTFTESSLWISTFGCDATADAGLDEPLWFSGVGAHKASPQYRRGAFRYMTVQSNGTGAVQLSSLSVFFTAYPQAAEGAIGEYPGYFHCNDEELNAVWYAGAYTNQICQITADSGNSLVHLGTILSADDDSFLTTWYNNYTITEGTVAFVDGAKRDRTVWPGDYTISLPSTFIASSDLTGIRNGLDSLFALQNSSGAMPYAGIPFYPELVAILGPSFWSFTYHCHGLTDLYLYYLYTGDKAYLQQYWAKAKLGLEFALTLVDGTGMALIPAGNPDWLRNYMGGYNIEANSILYRLISQMTFLATALSDTTPIPRWTTLAAGIKSAANAMLWSEDDGLYTDNTTTTFHPQDGNVFAIISGLADPSRAATVSSNLAARWTPYGPPAPEAGATISPFITSFELQAHFAVRQPQRSVDLMKNMYFGWMMNNPQMTNSTFVEGYSTDGSLVYPAYKNNPRISHAHGWSTGPVSALSQLVAGIQFLSAAGKTWLFAPQVADLTDIEAGFPSALGMFSANYAAVGTTGFLYQVAAPGGTSGAVSVVKPAGCTKAGVAVLSKGTVGMAEVAKVDVADVKGVRRKVVPASAASVDFKGLKGGEWTVYFACGS